MFVQPQRLNGCNLAAPPTKHEYYGRRIILHKRCSCDFWTRSSFGFQCCSGLLQTLAMQLIQFILTIESFNSAAQCFSNGCHFAKSCLLVEGLCGIVLVTAKGLGVLTAHIKSFVSHVPENDMLLSTGNSQSALQPICVLGVRNAGRR